MPSLRMILSEFPDESYLTEEEEENIYLAETVVTMTITLEQ